MKRRGIVMACLAVFATAASAQNVDVIKSRQAIYKSFGAATKRPGQMLQGSEPFDAQVVKAALDTYIEGAQKLPGLFPDDSKAGNDTHALPAIWDNKDDFVARFAKLGADARAARDAIKDEASFKTEFPKVAADCGGCHTKYRAKL